ncbi:MAG TPA: shikimate kinase [Methanocorpusculum sp.]|nr:shikimate kinase [Methanocorpusculum sp.]
MKGKGVSGGALTVINAIATGFGSAFGIGLTTSAEVTLVDEPGVNLSVNGHEADAGFAKGLLEGFKEAFPESDFKGADVKTQSDIPQSKGLKSSSAAANAILLAAADASGIEADSLDLVRIGAKASIACGVSVTGAFDDASACMLGGLVFTDNRNMRLIEHRKMPEEFAVVIHIPDGEIPTLAFPKDKFKARSKEIEAAFEKSVSGDVFSAIYENGRCVGESIGIGTVTADKALAAKASAAGISGTGPATGILVKKENLASFLDIFEEKNCIITTVRNP